MFMHTYLLPIAVHVTSVEVSLVYLYLLALALSDVASNSNRDNLTGTRRRQATLTKLKCCLLHQPLTRQQGSKKKKKVAKLNGILCRGCVASSLRCLLFPHSQLFSIVYS
ncbi:unnamed protein product [Ceratitis capitata]|uniref:(Mediterranean fruit fly) hypothetical protein n=1 Tax=Ceratitis capitata TaxID=7213 RepID=A0A811UB83_CERCA|nr:unnamed protein product [Ceratitis capitata]